MSLQGQLIVSRCQVAKVKKSVDALGIPDGNFVYDGAIAQAMMEVRSQHLD